MTGVTRRFRTRRVVPKIIILSFLVALVSAWSGIAVMRLSKDFSNKNLFYGRNLNTVERERVATDLPDLWMPVATVSDLDIIEQPVPLECPAPRPVAPARVDRTSRSPPSLSC